jgi:hypothetical protein
VAAPTTSGSVVMDVAIPVKEEYAASSPIFREACR